MTQERCEQLKELGLDFDFNCNGDGGNYVYRDINFHVTDIICMSDDEWEKALSGAKNRKQQLVEEDERIIELAQQQYDQYDIEYPDTYEGYKV